MKNYELNFTYPKNRKLKLIVNENVVLKILSYYWTDHGNSPLSVEIKKIELQDEE